jgi:hypothetical protein
MALVCESILTEAQVNEAQNSPILHPSVVHARNPTLGSTKDRCGCSQEWRLLLPWPIVKLDARRSDKIVGQGCTSQRVVVSTVRCGAQLMDNCRFSHSGPFLEIISTLLSSSLCPKPVMSLCAQALVRAFSDPRARGNGATPPPSLVNLWNTVNKGLGFPESTSPCFYFPSASSCQR